MSVLQRMLLQSSCRDNAESQTTQQDVVHMFLNAYFNSKFLVAVHILDTRWRRCQTDPINNGRSKMHKEMIRHAILFFMHSGPNTLENNEAVTHPSVSIYIKAT